MGLQDVKSIKDNLWDVKAIILGLAWLDLHEVKEIGKSDRPAAFPDIIMTTQFYCGRLYPFAVTGRAC